MQSISQAQASLGSNFTAGGIAREVPFELDNVEEVMMIAANKFIQLARKRIDDRKKNDTGNLYNIEKNITIEDGKYILSIGYGKSNPASKYYDYQNKGVKGLDSGKPSSSPYFFKEYWVSKNMVESLVQWYLRHKSYIKNEDQKQGLTKLQNKRQSLGNVASPQARLRQIAKNTAKNIKKRGLPRIGFFDDNIPIAFGDEFKAKLAKALGQDVVLNIRQNFK